MLKFPCNQCGLCCQNVNLASETQYLDRGDGTCYNYDTAVKGCKIYASRPDICRVDKQYLTRYAQQYTWTEFIELNVNICASLQSLESSNAKEKALNYAREQVIRIYPFSHKKET